MTRKHLVNIGFPRSGTTWLWTHLGLEPKLNKENTILISGVDFKQYKNYYDRFDYSANFNPSLWSVDREIIRFLQEYASHITWIIRPPLDFITSYFNLISPNFPNSQNKLQEMLDFIVFSGFFDYNKILERWNHDKFKIFFFDDLVDDPKKFLKNYADHCGIDLQINHRTNYNEKINATRITFDDNLPINDRHIDFVNNQITTFQSRVGRNLSHWKI